VRAHEPLAAEFNHKRQNTLFAHAARIHALVAPMLPEQPFGAGVARPKAHRPFAELPRRHSRQPDDLCVGVSLVSGDAVESRLHGRLFTLERLNKPEVVVYQRTGDLDPAIAVDRHGLQFSDLARAANQADPVLAEINKSRQSHYHHHKHLLRLT
jgi:hypothetical protein